MITSTMYCASGVSATVPQQQYSLDVRGSLYTVETEAIVLHLETDTRYRLRCAFCASAAAAGAEAPEDAILSVTYTSASATRRSLTNVDELLSHHRACTVACDMCYYATLPAGSRVAVRPSVRLHVCPILLAEGRKDIGSSNLVDSTW